MLDVALRQYIRRVFEEIPEGVRELPILAGGALRSFFDGQSVKDYDLFFRRNADYLAVKEAMRESSIELPTDYAGVNNLAADGRLFNLVGFEFKSPQEQIDRFDFRCCQMAAWMEGGEVRFIANDGAIADAFGKRLVVLNNNGEERTLRRIRHYVDDYGYFLVVPEEEPEEEHPRALGAPLLLDETVRLHIRRLPSGRSPYGA